MPDTLGDLTLKLSRDLSALEADCRQRAEALDVERQRALAAVPEASAALGAYDTACADAAAVRVKADAQADVARRDAMSRAERTREEALLANRRTYLDDDRRADDKKRDALADAARAYQSALDTIDRTIPLDRQFVERQKAFAKYQDAMAAADRDWQQALRRDRDAAQDADRDALDAERRDRDDAEAKYASATAASGTVYQAARTAAQIKLAAALARLPAAAAIVADFDARRQALDRDCRARQDALFAAFHDAVEQLPA